MTMKKWTRDSLYATGMALAATLIALAAPAHAATTTVRFSAFTPSTHFYQRLILQPWAQDVERVTEGRVRIAFTAAPLGPMPRNFDMVSSGIADASGGTHGSIAGRFGITQITKTPMMADVDAEAVSVALWKTHEKYLAAAKEHGDTHLLALHTNGPAHIFSIAKPIRDVNDFAGMKFVVPSPAEMQLAKNLKAVAVRLPGSEINDAISKGVVDGAFGSNTGVQGWKAEQYLRHQLVFPGGLMYSTFFIVMNKSKWESIGAMDRNAIMGVSGLTFAKRAGRVFADEDKRAVEARPSGAVSVTVANEAMQKSVIDAMHFIDDEWLPQARAAGIDGEAALAYFKREAREYAGSKGGK